jgi:hypothetical protein
VELFPHGSVEFACAREPLDAAKRQGRIE